MRLVLIDTAGIQPYIFGSNRLRENVGASYLVAQATGLWALQCVAQTFERHNISDGFEIERERTLEKDDLEAEVLYAAGGNVMLLCANGAPVETFVRSLSKKMLRAAPGLRLVVAQVGDEPQDTFDFGAQPLPRLVDRAFRKLFEVKRAWVPSAPLLGLGVTRKCQSTGLPAVALTRRIGDDMRLVYPASAEIHAKRRVTSPTGSGALDALEARLPLPDFCRDKLVYPRDFDHLGRERGQASYLAVVHADGNGMGKRIRALGKRFAELDGESSWTARNRSYIKALYGFSNAVDAAACAAQKAVIRRLCRTINLEKGEIVYRLPRQEPRQAGEDEGIDETHRVICIKLEPEKDKQDHPTGRWHLPFRPLVFGGDDLTFVCDGRLGLALTLHYLRTFAKEADERRDQIAPGTTDCITASAGVSIVKTHYPFSRAYGLAEALATSAKHLRRESRDNEPNWEASCLDWHFALGGLAGTLDLIRHREYRLSKQASGQNTPVDLTLRPVALETPPPQAKVQVWEAVSQGIKAFQGPGWAGRRGKLKRLREVLRAGPAQVEAFTEAHGALPLIEAIAAETDVRMLQARGLAGSRCAYFDAIELADFFIPESHFRANARDDAATPDDTA